MTGTALSGRKYKAYPEYKESTIDWLDKIPVNWETKRLKHLGQAIIGLTYSPDEIVEEKEESSTLVLRSSNVQSQKIAFDDNVFVNKEIPERLRTQINDILICSRNGSRALIGKNALIDAQSVDMSFGAFMTIFRSEYNKYLSHVMNSKLFEYQSGSFLTSTINQLTTGNLNSFEIPFPTRSERDSIAKFLDHETAKINTLIAKQEKLIELLKEKRQAVISHAVTKGLNPNAPMRDSGVEWLGEVPEHWETPKLIQLTSRIGDGLHSTPKYADGTGYYFVNGNNLKDGSIVISNTTKEVPEEEYKKHTVSLGANTVLLSINGTIGSTALFNHEPIILGKSAAYINCEIELNRNFLMRYLQSSHALRYYDLEVTGTTISNLSLNSIRQMKTALPPLKEQKEIVEYCAKQMKKYGDLIKKADKLILISKERKTALISAAVTGKIDVRDWKPQGV